MRPCSTLPESAPGSRKLFAIVLIIKILLALLCTRGVCRSSRLGASSSFGLSGIKTTASRSLRMNYSGVLSSLLHNWNVTPLVGSRQWDISNWSSAYKATIACLLWDDNPYRLYTTWDWEVAVHILRSRSKCDTFWKFKKFYFGNFDRLR